MGLCRGSVGTLPLTAFESRFAPANRGGDTAHLAEARGSPRRPALFLERKVDDVGYRVPRGQPERQKYQ